MKNEVDIQQFVTEAEVCRYLSIKPRTLQSWRSQGRGPAFIRLSDKCIRYQWKDIEQWLTNKQTK